MTEPEAVRSAVTARMHVWEIEPHPALDGETPQAVVRLERATLAAEPSS